MKKLKPLPKQIPNFSSYEEEAHFWDTHDTSSLIKKKNEVHVEFAKPMKHLFLLELPPRLFGSLRAEASKRHVPYQKFIQTLLAEKLHELHKKAA